MCCFFFKQKTAYEMRISDWSSDVCSSDLPSNLLAGSSNAGLDEPRQNLAFSLVQVNSLLIGPKFSLDDVVSMKMLIKLRDEAVKALVRDGKLLSREEIGRASCRERVCQYV